MAPMYLVSLSDLKTLLWYSKLSIIVHGVYIFICAVFSMGDQDTPGDLLCKLNHKLPIAIFLIIGVQTTLNWTCPNGSTPVKPERTGMLVKPDVVVVILKKREKKIPRFGHAPFR